MKFECKLLICIQVYGFKEINWFKVFILTLLVFLQQWQLVQELWKQIESLQITS